ncbi:peroxiredoxin-like family protein [Aspergillus saccharolyticus JOP 1030-1]|uniref:thioredoxin-dependent peroxiredoxin n=1 Tax=Aspergillus saccharolyticus JOP 1030-1 TaxID=1450539 RepID=A0A318Z954_9EURO|nr:redoxin domain-containing protein [Aspergillus saccharolyticus JOP 1030-1]PYH43921.1 redoxin domain-containing protein [Aspergillus saccharolyticus JOP 1030-1]
MSLQADLNTAYSDFQKAAPAAVVSTFGSGVQALQQTFDTSKAIQPGQALPSFELQDATGHPISSTTLLAKGPLLLSFYRGEWCPFCNLELRALQKRLPDFQAAGVTLVAISPQLPDASLSMAEKNALQFPVLSDVGNKLARQLGIVWEQPDSFKPILTGFGVDWSRGYGDESFAVPIPATILVGADGVVKNVFVDPDYTKRLEPETALEWVKSL